MRILLPAENWVEVMKFLFGKISRREFAQKMELLWDRRFTPVAQEWLHEWHKNVHIGILRFGAKDRWKKKQVYLQRCTRPALKGPRYREQPYKPVPIASVEIPGNITSFRSICISYVDPSVINFLHHLRPLLSQVHLIIGPSEPLGVWEMPTSALLADYQAALGPLLQTLRGPLESMFMCYHEILRLFNDFFPTVFAGAKLLKYEPRPYSFTEWTMQCLTNWLFLPHEEGQPRKLIMENFKRRDYTAFIQAIRKRFQAQNRPNCSFFIYLSFSRSCEDYRTKLENSLVENTKTGEKLVEQNNYSSLQISCYQVNEDKAKIAEIEHKLEYWDLYDKEQKLYVWKPQVGSVEVEEIIANASSDEQMPGTSKSDAGKIIHQPADVDKQSFGHAAWKRLYFPKKKPLKRKRPKKK